MKDQGNDYNDTAIARNNNVREIGTVGICDNGGGRTTMEVPDEDDDDDKFDKTNDTELVGMHRVITLRMVLHSMRLVDDFVREIEGGEGEHHSCTIYSCRCGND